MNDQTFTSLFIFIYLFICNAIVIINKSYNVSV